MGGGKIRKVKLSQKCPILKSSGGGGDGGLVLPTNTADDNSVPYFPEEDAKLRATGLSVRRGGNSSNSLEVLQQLIRASSPRPSLSCCHGGQAQQDAVPALHLVTTLPSRQSADTARILSSFDDNDDSDGGAAAHGDDGARGRGRGRGQQQQRLVNLDHCIYREDKTQATSSYIIRSQATGSRTIVNHLGTADLTKIEFIGVAEQFRDQDAETWWHFEVRTRDVPPPPRASGNSGCFSSDLQASEKRGCPIHSPPSFLRLCWSQVRDTTTITTITGPHSRNNTAMYPTLATPPPTVSHQRGNRETRQGWAARVGEGGGRRVLFQELGRGASFVT